MIPGSHRLDSDRFPRELEKHALACADAWGVDGREVPAYSLDSRPGDVAVMDQRLKHAAFGGGNRRRMFTINPTQRFADAHIGVLLDFIDKQHVWCVLTMYRTAMLRTAGPGAEVPPGAGAGQPGPSPGADICPECLPRPKLCQVIQ